MYFKVINAEFNEVLTEAFHCGWMGAPLKDATTLFKFRLH